MKSVIPVLTCTGCSDLSGSSFHTIAVCSIVRLPDSFASEEEALARQESAELAMLPEVAVQGEEILLPFGFVSHEPERNHGTAFNSDHR